MTRPTTAQLNAAYDQFNFWYDKAKKLDEELAKAEKRIAELEAVKADASQVFKEIGNELGCNPDNESIMMAIDALKERLATPVRLKKVDSSNVPYAGDGFNAAVDYCADRVRAAGFTVQGDE